MIASVKSCDLKGMARILISNPDIINDKNHKGWSPLVVGCHIGDIDVVNLLVNFGAEPNSCGDNGTAALMYAKESLLNTNKDYGLLDLLINAGAEILRCDKYGNDILYYVKKSGDSRMYTYFTDKLDSN